MTLVGHQFSPIVAMQKGVDRGQRHAATQRLFELGLDLTHHQDAAFTSLLQKRLEYSGFLVQGEVLPASTPTRGNRAITHCFTLYESVALFADPPN